VIFQWECELQRDAKGKGRKWQESKQETDRHTQGSETTQQHRPTQNTTDTGEAAQEHKPTGTEKSNNHTRHNPEQARPPNASSTDTKQKPVPAAQDSESSREKARLRHSMEAQDNPSGGTCQAPWQRSTGPTITEGGRKGNRSPQYMTPGCCTGESHQRGAAAGVA
jgi:hypothetical protein